MRTIIHIFALCITVFVQALYGQDIHFTQFDRSPLNLNPANAGDFNGDIRAGAIYRNQWRAVPVPYSTFSMFGDMSFTGKVRQGDKNGVGLLFNHDVSGDGRYQTAQLYVPVSHIIVPKKDTNLNIGIGFMPGFSNLSFKTNKFYYDKQWDGDAYNPGLPTGEDYPTLSKTYIDLNLGFNVKYTFLQRGWIKAGSSFSHLNSPNVSFFNNNEIRLDRKIQPFIMVNYPINPKVDVGADVYMARQGKFHETLIGLRGNYLLNLEDNIAVNAGMYVRTKDAFMLRAGLDYKNFLFGLSYDVNTSGFRPATNGRGAIEFSVIYIYSKPRPFTPKKRSCPVYM